MSAKTHFNRNITNHWTRRSAHSQFSSLYTFKTFGIFKVPILSVLLLASFVSVFHIIHFFLQFSTYFNNLPIKWAAHSKLSSQVTLKTLRPFKVSILSLQLLGFFLLYYIIMEYFSHFSTFLIIPRVQWAACYLLNSQTIFNSSTLSVQSFIFR